LLVCRVDAIAEVVVPQELPDILDRIELGRIAGQMDPRQCGNKRQRVCTPIALLLAALDVQATTEHLRNGPPA
jgi:hypothetical protein